MNEKELNKNNAPDSDFDKPIEDHIEEMLGRSLIIFSVAISVGLIMIPLSDTIIELLWNLHIPEPSTNRPRVYNPWSTLLTRLKIIFLGSLSLGLPVIIYQSYLFMKPGLYKNEEYYFKLSSGLSIFLSGFSIIISNYIVIPLLFSVFTSYSEGSAILAYGLQDTIGLMVLIMIYLVIIFQIPILMTLAVITDLVDINWIRKKRLIFWSVFFGLAFITSPDPTGMTPLIIGLIMLMLYEITLLVLDRLDIN